MQVSQPLTGTAVLSGNNGIIYTPPLSFTGDVTFTYHVSDGHSLNNGLVTISTFLCPPGVIFVNSQATGQKSGASWANALTDLQAGINLASRCGSEVWVAAGVYKPQVQGTIILTNGLQLFGGFAGHETTRAQRHWATHQTILSGDIDNNDQTTASGIITTAAHITGNNSHHIITANSLTQTALLDGFIVTGGQANGPSLNNNDIGAGLYSQNSHLRLQNIVFMGHTATASGGGLTALGSTIDMTNIHLSGNSALATGGGLFSYNSTLTLTHVTLNHNTAHHGGGALAHDTSTILIQNSLLWDNHNQLGSHTITSTLLGNNTPHIRYSLLQGSGGSGITWQSSLGLDGGHNIDADPQFVPGHIPYLSHTSPALNIADTAHCPPTDLAHFPRPHGPGCEPGAYEQVAPTLSGHLLTPSTAHLHWQNIHPGPYTLWRSHSPYTSFAPLATDLTTPPYIENTAVNSPTQNTYYTLHNQTTGDPSNYLGLFTYALSIPSE